MVAWHGNYVPYKYDLGKFNVVNSVSYDHMVRLHWWTLLLVVIIRFFLDCSPYCMLVQSIFWFLHHLVEESLSQCAFSQ